MLLRHKIKYYATPVLIVSMFFIIYQIIIFTQLSNVGKTNKMDINDVIVNGTHKKEESLYLKQEDGTFKCIYSQELIEYQQINDDYCDCNDGTDEPGTNACANGKFYCRTQTRNGKFRNSFPTSRVNDGICDCCDGSDELQENYHYILDGLYTSINKVLCTYINTDINKK